MKYFEQFPTLVYNKYEVKNIISKIKHIVFELNVHQSVIVNTDDVLIIKYICSIDKPTYIKSMLADQSTVYYIKFYKNTNNNEYLNASAIISEL